MRRKLVAANWKMNLHFEEVIDLMETLESSASRFECEVAICAPFIHLNMLTENFSEHFIIAAQNVSQHPNGAYTGEVSASQLSDLAVEMVLVGHSERREHFGETDAVVLQKLRAVLAHHMRPILCCGEPARVRDADTQHNYVLQQLQETVFQLSEDEMKQVVIAYEPIWAIGTGQNATPAQAQDMHAFIRQSLQQKFGEETANHTRIIYGGSCKPANAAALFVCPDVDGGLIGGASLNAADFLAIVAEAA